MSGGGMRGQRWGHGVMAVHNIFLTVIGRGHSLFFGLVEPRKKPFYIRILSMPSELNAARPLKFISNISLGVRFMALGAVLFSLGSASIKMAGEYLPSSQILFVRALFGLGFCFWLMRKSGGTLLGNNKPLLFLRGIFGACAFFTMIYAYVHLPLADATVIILMNPVLVAVMAAVILKEKLSPRALVCIMASLAGVVLVTKPGFLFAHASHLDHMGVLMALGAVFFRASGILSIRKLTETEQPASIMFYSLLITLVAMPAFDGINWIMPGPKELVLMVMVGVFMNAGQYYMTKSYGHGTAATISAVGYLEIAFAALWGVLIFSDVPDALSIAGSVLIVGSTYILGRMRPSG